MTSQIPEAKGSEGQVDGTGGVLGKPGKPRLRGGDGAVGLNFTEQQDAVGCPWAGRGSEGPGVQ